MAPKKITNSPFRYPGGKFYARKLILESIPSHESYCEVFAGGGSIFFAKQLVKNNVLNDLDFELMNCYRAIKNNVENLIDLLKGIPATKELHTYYKNEYYPKSDLERAFRYYYLNRTSYSGIMKKANCYFGYGDKYSMRPENWPSHLRTCSEKLSNVDLLSLDFDDLLDHLPEGYFLFIDPPYFNADQDKFYNCSFSKEDHFRLEKSLYNYRTKFKFLITYDDCDEIRELYSWCNDILNKEWNYTIARTDDQKKNLKLSDGHIGKRGKGKEIFITNYLQTEADGVLSENYKDIGQPLLSI